MTSDQAVAASIAERFVAAPELHGVPLDAIQTAHHLSDEAVRECVGRLIAAGEVSVVFARYDPNPNIKRLESAPISQQLDWLNTEPLSEGMVFPERRLVQDLVPEDMYVGRPYDRRLALGDAQLHPVFFEPMVLERYRRDPRYFFRFEDYSGMISVGDESYQSDTFPERDKVLIQSFGLGWRPDRSPLVATPLYYLTDLSPEHQAYWGSFEVADDDGCLIDPDYYRNSVLGEWTEHGSIIAAILEEERLINEMAAAMERPPLFLKIYDGDRPLELTPFLVPTTRNFESFCLVLDQVLSDNLSANFFRGEVPGEEETERSDGRIEVRAIGTIRQLEMWLRTFFLPIEGDPVTPVVDSFQSVRRARRKPAHRPVDDKYDPSLWVTYGELLEKAYAGLHTLRLIFRNFPGCGDVAVPDWLADGRIRNYAPPKPAKSS